MSSCDSSRVKDITVFPFRLKAGDSNPDRASPSAVKVHTPGQKEQKRLGREYGRLEKRKYDWPKPAEICNNFY